MAAVEATYAQYSAWGGQAAEDEFSALLPRARAAVGHVVGVNEVTDEDAYREAVFAALDAYAEAGPAGAGFTIGTFKMEGSSAAKARQAAIDAAFEVLATTGMAYMGVG